MPITEQGMVASINRAKIWKVDIQLVINDWLNTHSKGEHCYVLPLHDGVLRQDDLPADAHVLWAHFDGDTAGRDDAIRAARSFVRDVQALTPDPERPDLSVIERSEATTRHVACADLLARLDAATAVPPTRYLVVGIESEWFALVPHGGEPEHPFDNAAFYPPPPVEE